MKFGVIVGFHSSQLLAAEQRKPFGRNTYGLKNYKNCKTVKTYLWQNNVKFGVIVGFHSFQFLADEQRKPFGGNTYRLKNCKNCKTVKTVKL